jgi:hypothetical protein
MLYKIDLLKLKKQILENQQNEKKNAIKQSASKINIYFSISAK